MSQELTKIKKRISTVSSAYKVTSAMKLVSTVKLKKWKNKMIANRNYSLRMDEITKELFKYANDVESPFMNLSNKSDKNLYIIVSSTLGLCGAYNQNIFKVADVALTEKDDAIIFGGKALARYEDGKFNKITDFADYKNVNDEEIIDYLCTFVMNKYIDGTYKEIHIIYSQYKNSLTFLAKNYQVLPLFIEGEKDIGYGPILEPNPQELVSTLMPIYIKETLFSKLLESEVCEQASRSNAMENATNNAKEILDGLKIEFNKARQGAITQEIIEIVGAAGSV